MKTTKDILTDAKVAAIKPGPKPRKYSDYGRLYLHVSTAGSKVWKWAYRFDGKDRVYNDIGRFPAVKVEHARARRAELETLVEAGIDPIEHDKATALAAEQALAEQHADNTLWPVVLEWLADAAKQRKWSDYYRLQAERFLTKYVKDGLGAMPVAEIEVDHVYKLLKSVASRDGANSLIGEVKEDGAPHIAIRLRGHLAGVFQHAVLTRRASSNPVTAFKSGAAINRPPTRNNVALDPPDLAVLLRRIDAGGGSRMTRIGLLLILLTFVRTVELRKATWSEFDFDNAVWNIPAGRMKMRKPHTVPLSAQAVLLLRELRNICPPTKSGWLFPNTKGDKAKAVVQSGGKLTDTCMDANTFNRALKRLGFAGKEGLGFTCHGARGTANTLLSEMGFSDKAIDRQLAHQERNAVRRAYDRSKHLAYRTDMMQRWADALDELRENPNLTPSATNGA